MKSKPATFGAIAAGAAVLVGGLTATSGIAFADDDDDYENYACTTDRAVNTRDDEDDDDRYETEDDERDCDDAPSPSTSPTPAPTATPTPVVGAELAANAELLVERAGARRLAVQAGVENSAPGEAWRLEVWQNGRQRLTTTRLADTTGQIEINRSLKNRPGKDRIRLTATNSAGERVSAKVQGFKAATRPPQNTKPNPSGSNGNAGNNNSGNNNNSGGNGNNGNGNNYNETKPS